MTEQLLAQLLESPSGTGRVEPRGEHQPDSRHDQRTGCQPADPFSLAALARLAGTRRPDRRRSGAPGARTASTCDRFEPNTVGPLLPIVRCCAAPRGLWLSARDENRWTEPSRSLRDALSAVRSGRIRPIFPRLLALLPAMAESADMRTRLVQAVMRSFNCDTLGCQVAVARTLIGPLGDQVPIRSRKVVILPHSISRGPRPAPRAETASPSGDSNSSTGGFSSCAGTA